MLGSISSKSDCDPSVTDLRANRLDCQPISKNAKLDKVVSAILGSEHEVGCDASWSLPDGGNLALGRTHAFVGTYAANSFRIWLLDCRRLSG
jgi:hypothetical protein